MSTMEPWPTTSVSWRCGRCGQLVGTHQVHSCNTYQEPFGDGVNPFGYPPYNPIPIPSPPVVDWNTQRIADALEKILERLDNICEEVRGCDDGGSEDSPGETGGFDVTEELQAFRDLARGIGRTAPDERT